MQRLIQTLSLAGAFLTLCVGIWQGWAFVVAVKKVLIAYMGVFFISSAMVLAVRMAGNGEDGHSQEPGSASRPPQGQG